jgi:hypothetical protein
MRGGGGGGAAAGAAVAGSAAAARPLYVYFTTPRAASEAAQKVSVCSLAGGWDTAVETNMARSMLETLIKDSAGHCLPNVAERYVKDQVVYARNPMLLMLSNDYYTHIGRLLRGAAAAAAAAAAPAAAAAAETISRVPPRSLGFIMARFTTSAAGTQGIYLDVICTAKGLGHSFINFFHKLAFDNGAAFVKLSSLANVLAYYYSKHNYRFRTSCESAPLVELSSALSTRDFKTRPPPASTAESYDDSDFMDFMYDKLYTVADLGVRSAARCKQRAPLISKAEYKAGDCAQDGFTMMKCSRAGGARKTRRGSRRSRRSRRSRCH